jgi:HSP20 family protein
MRSRLPGVVIPFDVGDFVDEVRSVFLELGRAFDFESSAGESSPSIDIVETHDAVEVIVDLPGVPLEAVRVMAKGDALLVVGEKAPGRLRTDSTFHLVERSFGRFARTVRLAAPCETERARATLIDGELRIWLPKIGDRRGRTILIPVGESAHSPSNHKGDTDHQK